MIRKVQAVVVTFEHEDTPSYTVALFFEKTEAQKLRRTIEANVEDATSEFGLNETIKDVYVIDTPIHSSAENYIAKYMGTGKKDTTSVRQSQSTQAWRRPVGNVKRKKSCRYCLNMRPFGKEGSSHCPLISGKKSKVCQFFVWDDVKKKVRIGYDDGTYSEFNIFPDMEFGSFNAAKTYLAIYLKSEPDEKKEHYFLHPVKS